MLIVSALITALISPLGAALVLGLIALAMGLGRWRKSALVLGIVAWAWLTGWTLPVSANWIQAQVSRDHPPIVTDEQIMRIPKAGAIVLLGGGVKPPTVDRPWPDFTKASDRVWQAARLWHAGRAPLVLASGGHDPASHTQSEAEATRTVLLAYGVPDQAIVLETRSRNTRQNASDSAVLLSERGIRRILLVTSAAHMTRALAHFRGTGLEAVPVPTDHQSIDFADLRRFIPNAEALELSARALKEWVGQIVW